MTVRRAAVEDASALSALLADYLREKYPSHRGTSADELRRDVLSDTGGHRVLLADGRGGPVGFVSWDPVYDMHWAARGAQVADLYVVPSARGLGIAIALLLGYVPRPALKVQLSCGADPMTEPLRRAGSMSVSRSGSIRPSVTVRAKRSGDWRTFMVTRPGLSSVRCPLKSGTFKLEF